MKNLILVLVTLISVTLLFSANLIPDSPEYNTYKQNLVNQMSEANSPAVNFTFSNQSKDAPALLIPLDGTFTEAMPRNDDGSSAQIMLPWTFTLYGTPYTSFWINNNGNITFTGSYSSFTSTGFPLAGMPMLAPFWADVDTRNAASGVVWYRIETNPNRVVVIWDNVGYYGNMADKLNTFSAIFTDGTDPLIGIGNNVVFSYGDMQWTTGSASGGAGGFGGTAATVGINEGVGGNYTQAGRFDQPGSVYDGEGGSNDGVDWLDDRDLYLAAMGANILIVLPADPEVVTSGIGMPPGVPSNDPTFSTYTATFDANGFQTVSIPVGAGTWRGWIYYTGAWHQADVFPVYGPGSVVFSNVPFSGGKDTVPIIIDLEDVTLPVVLSSFTATLTAQNNVKLTWVSQSETGMLGYRVYRNDSNSQSDAMMITPVLVGATNTSTTQTYSITDNEVEIGNTYWYWLESVDYNSSAFHGPVSVIVEGNTPPVVPEQTVLRNAYPNPFKAVGGTTIEVDVKDNDAGRIAIYNLAGQEVISFTVTPGMNRINWNGKDERGNVCGSGIYFYRLSTPSLNQTRKLVIVK